MKFIFLFLLGFMTLANAQDWTNQAPESPSAPAAEKDDAATVLKRVEATYKAMQTYCSNGTVYSERMEGSTKIQTTTTFAINLKKPNLYVITWSQTSIPAALPQGGAVWNDGKQPYLYLLMNKTYARVSSDIAALGAANSVSAGVSDTIPSLFFPAFTDNSSPLARLKDPVIEKSDFLGGQECYVISGESTLSKKETFWISKSDNLVLKHEKSLEPPEGGVAINGVSEEIIEKAIRSMGQPVTEENKKQVMAMMQTAKGTMNNVGANGISTEMQMQITHPNFTPSDFHFTPPADSIFSDTMMGPQTEAAPASPSPTNAAPAQSPPPAP